MVPLSLGALCLARLPGRKEILVVATDYETYAIMDVVLHQGLKNHRVLKLYSKPAVTRQGCVSAAPSVPGPGLTMGLQL